MRIGVVVSCYRQERFLARTLSAVERALEGEDWQGVLELAVPSDEPLHALTAHGQAISAFDPTTRKPGRPLTPGAGRMLGFAACGGDWVLFMDSDVELDSRWMRAAIAAGPLSPTLQESARRLDALIARLAADSAGAAAVDAAARR
jgi:hypothetical protein